MPLDHACLWRDRIEDPVVDSLTDAQECLWARLMHVVDSWGRTLCDPRAIGSLAYPRRPKPGEAVIQDLQVLVDKGLLIGYQAENGRYYLSFKPASWEKRQRFGHRRRTSEYPAPSDEDVERAQARYLSTFADLCGPLPTFTNLPEGTVREGKVRKGTVRRGGGLGEGNPGGLHVQPPGKNPQDPPKDDPERKARIEASLAAGEYHLAEGLLERAVWEQMRRDWMRARVEETEGKPEGD